MCFQTSNCKKMQICRYLGRSPRGYEKRCKSADEPVSSKIPADLHWRCIKPDMVLPTPQSHLPPVIIAAFWAAISPKLALSRKIAAKKGLISLVRVQKSVFGPLFPKIRPQMTSISHRRDEFDKITPQKALIHPPGF